MTSKIKIIFYKRKNCHGYFSIVQVMEYMLSSEILVLALHCTEDFPYLCKLILGAIESGSPKPVQEHTQVI